MKNHWELFIHLHHHHHHDHDHDHDGHDGRDSCLSSTDPLLLKSLRLWSRLTSLVDHSKHIFLPQISASRLPFARFSKLPADCLSHIKTNFPDDDDHPFSSPNPIFFTHLPPLAKPNLMGAFFPQRQYLATLFFHAISTVKHLFKRPDDVQMLPFLSLASAIITPIANLTSIMLAIPPADASVPILGSLNQTPCDVQHQGGLGHSFPDLNWIRRAVEPITGIEFPGILNNILAKENQSSLSSEVLVGTGSRIVTIIKIRSLKVYAFGFYVHPYSVCQKLGSKYASVPASELKDHNEFYADLLREDIGMTVRLVINCSGMKINAVKDTFEKSLRARLAKTNPETDFKCIETFGSFFTTDIPLPVGTIIDLRRTADGQLITEIGGNQIGAVHSRELCRAFFDMYLGEVPVSKEAKEEIGSNVASIVGRC